MPVQVSYPGVYVQEESSGARAIAGVATSVAMFVGMAERGRMNVPVRVFNIAGFERDFGTHTSGELATQVRQFFINGGGTAWIGRIADGALNAEVMLRDQTNSKDALRVSARDPGLEGNLLRVEIDYDTASPEETFNLTVFRSRIKPDGSREREVPETYAGLSMNPASGAFVESVINNASSLIRVSSEVPADTGGISISGRVLPSAETAVGPALSTLVTDSARSLNITLGSHPPVLVHLTPIARIANSNVIANIETRWTQDINTALSSNGIGATVMAAFSTNALNTGGIAGARLLSVGSTTGPVRITAAAATNVTQALMLGTEAGGLEGSAYGDARPAPSGVVARMGRFANTFQELRNFAGQDRNALQDFSLTDDSSNPPYTGVLALGGAVPMHESGGSNSLANVRAVLDTVALRINESAHVLGDPRQYWQARRHGVRLALYPRYGNDNTGPSTVLISTNGGGAGYNFGVVAFLPSQAANAAAYTVGLPGGLAGAGNFQVAAGGGSNGTIPGSQQYADFFTIVDRDVDLFNLMVLPRAEGQTDDQRQALWGLASSFCARKRAFLLVDPRSGWADVTQAEAGVDQLRIGVDTRNSAAYWPRLHIQNGSPGGRFIDPSGSIAGLIARTDGNRGVWKAPAGLEATVRGVSGLERRMSDPENGVINPKALNAIRLFPAGVVSWGARTLVGFDGSGNIDDKYIPVRRTMLFIEESLYRGLHFAVFEPNDEPLWAQIRLAAGSFMNSLFRKGAFAGAKASDAYFVSCDSSTTTADDINLGIVNVVVGFAPLKPAEFVVLTVKQIAGQAEV